MKNKSDVQGNNWFFPEEETWFPLLRQLHKQALSVAFLYPSCLLVSYNTFLYHVFEFPFQPQWSFPFILAYSIYAFLIYVDSFPVCAHSDIEYKVKIQVSPWILSNFVYAIITWVWIECSTLVILKLCQETYFPLLLTHPHKHTKKEKKRKRNLEF